MPLWDHIMASLWYLLQMLRDKRGSKYAVLFNNLNIICKFIRFCHLYTYSCSLCGSDTPLQQHALPKDRRCRGGDLVQVPHTGGKELGRQIFEGITDSAAVLKSLTPFLMFESWQIFKPTSLSLGQVSKKAKVLLALTSVGISNHPSPGPYPNPIP